MRVRKAETISIYKHAIENSLYLEKTITRKKRLKVLAYILFGVVFFSYRDDDSNSSIVHVINGKSQFRTRNFKGIPELYYGLTFTNWKEIKHQNSHISYISRKERAKALFSSLLSYGNVKSYGGCYAYWLDFCLWSIYISIIKPSVIVSNGHYDRLTTTLSELCRINSVEFHMKQHGLLAADGFYIPHKIHCEKVYAYDDIQADVFRKCIIENDDCLYETWYKPGFEFVSNRFDKFTIGIIENKNVENQVTEIYDILKTISKYGTENHDVVIMLHPLSKQSEYEKLVKNCRCNVTFTREKYIDFNMIISTPSTLAYDYVRSGYTGPIIFAQFILRVKDGLENYKNVIHVGSPDELDHIVAEMLKI